MWIVPKTLSAFVQDTEVWSGVSEERAWMLEQSVTANGKHMSKQYWLKRLKKGDSILLQYGQTLRPSHQQNFTERYTDSLADIHANRLVALEKEKAKRIQGTCGQELENTPGQLEFNGFSPKMSKDTYRLDSPQSSAIWKKMVTRRRGEYLVRRKLVRHTKGSEFTSWPTPRTGGGSRPNGKGGKVLNEEVQIEAGLRERGEVLAEEAKKYAGHQGQGNPSTNGSHREQLSPDWVECLMGLPIGTSDLCCSATESSHKQQN
jgi:hypothetical protein